MDIQMPGLNGLEATKKQREEGITTRIAALTAYAMAEDRDNACHTLFARNNLYVFDLPRRNLTRLDYHFGRTWPNILGLDYV